MPNSCSLPTKVWDVAIIGAGAAGLMAAIQARRAGHDVLLLDAKEKIGAKILMSGGTRCNLTNQKVTIDDFQTEQKNIARAVLAAFPSDAAVKFFQELGIEVVLEPGGKYFPATHSGRTVLDALLREIRTIGVVLETNQKVTSIGFEKNEFVFLNHRARTVVLTTGGLSFPATGSDGTGYGIAKSFGHTLIPTTPSLTPLSTDDEDWKKIAGVSLPVRLSMEKVSYEGSFLFTHVGFSGPVVLNISRHWIRNTPSPSPLPLEGERGNPFFPSPSGRGLGEGMRANFLPATNGEKFREVLKAQKPGVLLKTFLTNELPERFVEVLLRKINVPLNVTLNQLKREDRERLIQALFHFPLPVNGDLGYAKAEVTAGGIDLREIDKATLESKLQPGLFFAGEILDVDGRIGGFNFQWAWASAVVAARGVCRT